MKDIEIFAWWSNTDWYVPQKQVDLSQYHHVELIQQGHEVDLFLAWNGTEKTSGRLFKGKWNSGVPVK